MTHSLSLKISEKTDTTEQAAFVNGAKNQPDKVTLNVIETDAAHSAVGWASRMMDVLSSVKRRRLLCQVVTAHHKYDNMLLSDLSVTQDEEHPDGWSGEITFTEVTQPDQSAAASAASKTDTNSSVPKNVGSAAPAVKVSGVVVDIPKAISAGVSASVGALVTGMLEMKSGSALEQKMTRSGISTGEALYIK